VVLWLGWVGCALFEVPGSGVAAEETRELSDFREVIQGTEVSVEVTVGDEQQLPTATVRCDDNLIELIETVVEGEVLRVRTPPNTNLGPTVPCSVLLVVPRADMLQAMTDTGSGALVAIGDWPALLEVRSTGSGRVMVEGELAGLELVTSTGSGGIELPGIGSHALSAKSTGSGSILLSGAVDFVELETTGSGGLRALELSTVDADIRSTGSGSVWLTATGAVEAHLTGSGDVYLQGDPDVDSHTSGSGRVFLE
jgi:hypothetical protein